MSYSRFQIILLAHHMPFINYTAERLQCDIITAKKIILARAESKASCLAVATRRGVNFNVGADRRDNHR
jgi:isocitrate lyase